MRRLRARKNQVMPPMTAIAAIPQPTPIPAAAPALSPEELFVEDCPIGTVVAVELDIPVDAVGEPVESVGLLVVRLVVTAEEGEEVATVPVWEAAEGFTVVVLKSSR